MIDGVNYCVVQEGVASLLYELGLKTGNTTSTSLRAGNNRRPLPASKSQFFIPNFCMNRII